MNDVVVPAADPRLRFNKFEDELLKASQKFLRQGSYILGEAVQKFEKSFAAYIGTKYAVAVNSGTDALFLGLLAAGIKPEDEVITTSVSAPATVVAILRAGAVPVVVDVEGPACCLSPTQAERAITAKTKVILPVHLHGYAANMNKLCALARKYDLSVLEDCAQAQGADYGGARLGTLGKCAAFSFYPTKNLGCLGDGGAVTTDDPKLAEKLFALRHYGMDRHGRVTRIGANSRLDELQAAFLNILLPHLDDYNKKRVIYAHAYNDHFTEFSEVLPPIVPGSVYHQYAIRVENRDAFRQKLMDRGIATNIHYPYTMNDHSALSPYCHKVPQAEKCVGKFVSLPIQPEILDQHFEKIIQAVTQCLKAQ